MPDGDEALERLRVAGAATVYEGAGRRGALDAGVAAVGRSRCVVGSALTVRCHVGDNLAIHAALERAAPGDMLVVDGAGAAVGYLGDVLAVAAQVRGVVGAVIDGAVRDVAEIDRLGFPVWARHRAIRGATKHEPGDVGAPIVCGGVAVDTGDVIVADADGVVAVARSALAATVTATERRLRREREIVSQLRSGALTLDVMGLRGDACA
jgi:4-hydroxy-4-methyl-2-oxoglutarate aldolase